MKIRLKKSAGYVCHEAMVYILKRSFFSFTLACLFTYLTKGSKQIAEVTSNAEVKVINDVIARVGDVPITRVDLNLSMAQFDPIPPHKMEEVRRQCLENLIEQKLLLKDFQDKKGRVLSSQVDQQVDDILIQNFNGDAQGFMQYLQMKGQTWVGFEGDLKQSIVLHIMSQYHAKNDLSVSPKQARIYYQQHLEDFTESAQVLLEQKSFRANSVCLDGKTEVKKIDFYKKQREAGQSIAELAALLDEFHLPKDWYSSASLNETLSKSAFILPTGSYTEPILCKDVYFILHILDRKPARVKPFKEVFQQIQEILIQHKNENIYQRNIENLKSKTAIWISPEFLK